MKRPGFLLFATAFATILAIGTQVASADTVVPGGLAGSEANVNSNIPILRANNDFRMQIVFDAGEFPAGPIQISRIAFRPDAGLGSAYTTTIPDFRLNLSTTSAVPDGLSLTFVANVGADDTQVFSGPLMLSTAFTGPPTGPKDFDLVIDFSTPFPYNPANGNLLVDLRQVTPAPGISDVGSDAVSAPGDFVSAIYSLSGFAAACPGGGVGAADACQTTSIGTVIEFTFEETPTVPDGSLATRIALALLLALTLACAQWLRRVRRPLERS